MPCQLEQHLVPDDPASRHIPPLRFPFTPGCELPKNGCRLRLQLIPSPYALIAFLRFPPGLADRSFQARKLFMGPRQPAEFGQLGLQMIMDRQQKRHVFQCIGQLIVGQRSRTPIGERMGLVQSPSMHPLNKIGIGDL